MVSAAQSVLTGSNLNSLSPAKRGERVYAIDVLRGFALLGILLLNIDSFGSVQSAHDIPLIESFYGLHGHINFAVFLFKWLFFEGKARGLFSMLFGAGVLLLATRAEERGAAASVADIFTRRNLLLMLFGFLHGTFIWDGDILFDYGLSALLFLYPARKLKANWLIIGGIVLSVTLGTFGVLQFTGSIPDLVLSKQVRLVRQQQLAHQTLSPADQAVLKEWQDTIDQHTLTPALVDKQRAFGRGAYWQHVHENLSLYFGTRSVLHVDAMPETLSAMLLGMGLFKIGFLTAEAADSVYLITALLGFMISLPLYLCALLSAYNARFDFIVLDKWVWIPYDSTRIAGMLALAAVIMLIVKHGVLQVPQRWLAAIGRTALSNYIGTSLLCQLLFSWGPWKLFGRLEYYQLMYVVSGVWAVNIIGSTLWLRSFEFGPIEWVWRSLTYCKLQPMLPRAERTAMGADPV